MSKRSKREVVGQVLGSLDMIRAYNELGLGDVVNDVVTIEQVADALNRAILNAAIDHGYIEVAARPEAGDGSGEVMLVEASVARFYETYGKAIQRRLR